MATKGKGNAQPSPVTVHIISPLDSILKAESEYSKKSLPGFDVVLSGD